MAFELGDIVPADTTELEWPSRIVLIESSDSSS